MCVCAYVCAHMHMYVHVCMLEDIPSLEGAGKQIHAVKKLQGLEKVFLSTDAPIHGAVCPYQSPSPNTLTSLCSLCVYVYRAGIAGRPGGGRGLVHAH